MKVLDTTIDFNAISIKLASPDNIKEWSYGEVTKPETINYRTGRSERGGLFDERIFGPEKDYECYCGKYRRIRYKGIICEKCGVEITRSAVRRERMGHIELASPVAHIWFLRGIPSNMSILSGISVSNLERVIYFSGYIVIWVDQTKKEKIIKNLKKEYETKLKVDLDANEKEKLKERFLGAQTELKELLVGQVISEIEYHRFSLKYGASFKAEIGAEAIYNLFKNMDLKNLKEKTEVKLEEAKSSERIKLQKKLSLVRSMIRSGVRPEWMFLTVIPIIPPVLRPMVALEGGRHATSDLNDLYRRVINRNNRLKKLKDLNSPEVILRNEKRILQEAMDALIDNSIAKQSRGAAISQAQRRPLKSLSENLKGKRGLFRQNLLGKRVDYSGRSVIVVGPQLKINQCGLPKHMALELFRPFVISKILEQELAFNIRGANRLIEEGIPEVWAILEEVIAGKYVLLNRAPTLHRLSIQAFHPILIEGNAIQVHPLVCTAFNADFDGDQMAVHIPLSQEAQEESANLMAADNNLLNPQGGDPIINPKLDIVLGCFWMTKSVDGAKGEGLIFPRPNHAITAFDFGAVDFRAKIKVLGTDRPKYKKFEGRPFETSVGRLLFNSILPKDFDYINEEINVRRMSALILDLINDYGIPETARVLDKIKDFGFKYVTKSGITWGIDSVMVPPEKEEIIKGGRKKEEEVMEQYNQGLLSEEEKHRKLVEVWENIREEIQQVVSKHISEAGSAYDMLSSGARGSIGNITQMVGFKGLVQSPTGRIIDFPIIPSYKEGFSPIEYFISTHGSRKGLADTALNTAKAGYLTRRLVDVAQDVVVTEEDCGTKKGRIMRKQNVSGIEVLISEYIHSRVLLKDIKDKKGHVLYKKGTLVIRAIAEDIEKSGIEEVLVRSPLTCETLYGVCQQCYGLDLARGNLVNLGEAVGIIAAQSIGEPGTQLTLRTFHTGGVAGGVDITQGLPRVEELFERRNPPAAALVSKTDGIVSEIKEVDKSNIIVISSAKDNKKIEYEIPPKRVARIKVGQEIQAGERLTDGSASPADIFKYGGQELAEKYIIFEIDKVYRLQGVSISRKHFEIIVRQMFSRRKIKDAGDTIFSPGDVVEQITLVEENQRVEQKGNQPAKAEAALLSITETSLTTQSWLSAASFQNTNRVLIFNAIRGGVDKLRGLKENVIIGSYIPAGTGWKNKSSKTKEEKTE